MEIKSCNTHFIQAVKGGLVIKVRNRDSHGKPALASKFIKDVYDAEDALRLGGPSPVNRSMQAGLMLNSEHVKREIPCFPVVDRIFWEATVSVPEADVGVDFDLDDETTLTQLRKRFLIRKRKFSRIDSDRNTNQACTNEKAVEDESDLNEPLINWKLKNLKGSRSKRKCTTGVAVSSRSVKSEESQLSERSAEAGYELAPVLRIKSEVQESDELENQGRTFSGYLFSHADNEAPSPVGEAPNEFQKMADHECQEPVLPAKGHNWHTDEISNEHLEDVEPLCMLVPWGACNEAHNPVAETSEEFQKISDRDGEEPLLYAGGGQNCVTNEISYEHLEYVEPFYMLVPQEGINVKLETPEIDSQESPDFRNYSEVNSLSGGSSRRKEIFEQGSSFGFQVCNMSIEGTENHHELNGVRVENEFRTDSPQGRDDSHSFPSRKYGSSQDCISSVGICNNLDSTESTTLETEQPLTCTLDDIRKDGLSHAGHLEEKLSETRGKQTSAARITNVEMKSCKENQTFDSVNTDTQSTQELRQPPGRLLCTRKAISPSSQEQLCLAMNSAELRDDVDQYKSERKFFEKQTGKRTSSLRSDVQHAKIAANHGGNGKVIQRKVIISAKNIMNRSQGAKSNLEGPRFSRTLPSLNTGCTSIEGCSESAIAFSQRQLHDMEALAEKLMNELKSMKDIVEQKLLFEAYRNVSLRNDADEVKSAISNAAKVEEVAQKWLSMMARDCNRFCKIMKLSPRSAAASKDADPKQRRKIMFADEVGGKLCHVKVFEVGMNDGIKEVEHSI